MPVPTTDKFPLLPLAAMGFAAFVYVTYEMFVVGLITPMAADLGVTEGSIGLLMTVYAGVVAVVTIPLISWTSHLDRRPVYIATLFFLAAGVVLQATALNYAMLAAARVTAALTHGVFWSLVNPMAARLAGPGRTGKAVAVVSMGSTMALVAGSPLATFLGGTVGWRAATWAIGAGVALSVVVLLATLPPMPAVRAQAGDEEARARSALPSLIVFLLLAVTSVFVTYTYLGLIIERVTAPELVAPGLSLYGLFGVVGVVVAGRRVDKRMLRMNGLAQVLLLLAAAAGLGALAAQGVAALVLVFLLVAAIGTGAGAQPTSATTLFLFAGRENQDRASAIYVVTFQVGIASGSALGALTVDAGFLPGTLLATAALALGAGAVLTLWSRPLLR
ncbi:Sugar efflux transporter B [Corynebacterium auris]|nr:Sugar efflux transporter B [Corynebacterium auris]